MYKSDRLKRVNDLVAYKTSYLFQKSGIFLKIKLIQIRLLLTFFLNLFLFEVEAFEKIYFKND